MAAKPKPPQHDSLFKLALANKIVAQDFLLEHLPPELQQQFDISQVEIQQESHVDEELQKLFSDVILKMPLRGSKDQCGFVYILCEYQSSSDYWLAFRLLEYSMRLYSRHIKKRKKSKLPLVYLIVMYNGKRCFTAPRNFFDLFVRPDLARQFWGHDYQLINLPKIPNEELYNKHFIGMFEYMMKNIHEPDILAVWEEMLTNFKQDLKSEHVDI